MSDDGDDTGPVQPTIETTAVGEADTDVSAEERQRHIDHINDQLEAATCVDWERPAINEQRIQLEHDASPTFATLFESLRDDGWVPTELDVGDEETTLWVEKDPNLAPRIALDDCPECNAAALEFGDRVDGQGLASGKRVYCTACGAEWTVSFKVNNCNRGCCPFDREITLRPVYSESQKIGPASDEYDAVELVRGLDSDAKIEYHQRTRPDDKVTVYESPEEAPDTLVRSLRQTMEHENTASAEQRAAHWEERLAELDDADT